MSGRPVRVALFPDSLNEINGVANTCRNWVAYVHRNRFPMLVVSAAAKTEFRQEGTISRLDLQRGPLAFSVEKDLGFDATLVLFRYHKMVVKALREFRPEVVHITGPGDIGMIGAARPQSRNPHCRLLADQRSRVRRAPRRSHPAALVLRRPARQLLQTIERLSFRLAALYYKAARFHYAPNQELIEMLRAASGKPCSLMERGVDLALFNPAHRDPRQRRPVRHRLRRAALHGEKSPQLRPPGQSRPSRRLPARQVRLRGTRRRGKVA